MRIYSQSYPLPIWEKRGKLIKTVFTGECMRKVKITVIKSDCRSGYLKEGESFIVGDLCPPICHELWHAAYPYVFALQNGAELDSGEEKRPAFTVKCPDEGRVILMGEVTNE